MNVYHITATNGEDFVKAIVVEKDIELAETRLLEDLEKEKGIWTIKDSFQWGFEEGDILYLC